MSDIASSCEYLTIDRLCSAVSDSEKARSNRQAKCLMPEKTSCCYICQSRVQCPIKCMYLGSTEKQHLITEAKEPVEMQAPKAEDPKTTASRGTQTLCPSCYQEMSQAITRFKIDNWKESQHQLSEDREGENKFLVVRIYLCTQCGKIELKSDEKQLCREKGNGS